MTLVEDAKLKALVENSGGSWEVQMMKKQMLIQLKSGINEAPRSARGRICGQMVNNSIDIISAILFIKLW